MCNGTYTHVRPTFTYKCIIQSNIWILSRLLQVTFDFCYIFYFSCPVINNALENLSNLHYTKMQRMYKGRFLTQIHCLCNILHCNFFVKRKLHCKSVNVSLSISSVAEMFLNFSFTFLTFHSTTPVEFTITILFNLKNSWVASVEKVPSGLS